MIIFLLTLLVGALAAFFVHRQYSYWERKEIPYLKPNIPFGILNSVRRKERSFGLVVYDIYLNSKEKLLGIYLLFRPAILIRDAEIARQIMTTDFQSFHDRGVDVDDLADLFSARGQTWKTLRTKLTPSFSSGKLKAMLGTITDVGDKMVEHLNGVLGEKDSEVVEMKNIMTTYAIDIIASVIFGLDVNSFKDPDNVFRKLSSTIFSTRGIIATIHGMSAFICPPVGRFIEKCGYKDPILQTVIDIVRNTIRQREENKIIRKDMLQLLIQLRNTGKISEDDKNWDIETSADALKSMSIESIAAQLFLFYIAGSETTAATAAFTIYELSMHPELLQKAQTEVEEVLQRHGLKPTDKLTYDAIQDMKFLDLCIMETIRLYPGLPFLNRECTQDYQVPGTKYTIAKGTPIFISLFGLHRDPEYFPNPLTYDPERFLEEIHNYSTTAYMPFGEGPRHCIALRMGKMNSKVGIVKMLANFTVHTRPQKDVEFAYDPAPVLIAKDGINVRFSKKILSD